DEQGRPGRAVDLAAMMALHDLDVPILRQRSERRGHGAPQRHDAEAEVGGAQHGDAPRRLRQGSLVLGSESRGTGHQGGAALGARPGGITAGLGTAESHDHVSLPGATQECIAHARLPGPRPLKAIPRLTGPGSLTTQGSRTRKSCLDTESAGLERRRLHRPAHAARGADQDQRDHARAAWLPAATACLISRPEARAAATIAFSLAGSTGTSGSLSWFSSSFISESRYLTGAGLDSMNRALNRGSRRWCSFAASSSRLSRPRSHSDLISAGATFPTTDTTPLAPTAIIGRVRESS